jgi:hypothetical protein
MNLWDRDWDYEGLNASELVRYVFYTFSSIILDLIADLPWNIATVLMIGVANFITHEITTVLPTVQSPVYAVVLAIMPLLNFAINLAINERLRHAMDLSDKAKILSIIISAVTAIESLILAVII